MNVVLATGIYPPEIGGPATYACSLASELSRRGVSVAVVTYAKRKTLNKFCECHAEASRSMTFVSLSSFEWPQDDKGGLMSDTWSVVRIANSGCPLLRWFRYARALRRIGNDADIVIAFSSVSVGVPLLLARLTKPKTILRLGGDFLWERYTDRGGRLGLRDWYARQVSGFRFQVSGMGLLLRTFDHIVFSTRFQEELYEEHYGGEKGKGMWDTGKGKRGLPAHSIIENAVPSGMPMPRERHEPFRLLFMGRFVGFKNLTALIEAVAMLDDVTLTLVGDGPVKRRIRRQTERRRLHDRIVFLPPAHGQEILKVFSAHDLLVLPSLTEISPNTALEARAAGLPVLLTAETGLSDELRAGMVVRDLSTPQRIAGAVREIADDYERVAREAATAPPERGWGKIAEEWYSMCKSYI